MGTTYTLSGDLGALIGSASIHAAYVRTNLPAGAALIDRTATANSVKLGLGRIPMVDGVFEVELLGTANTSLNVAANTLRYEVFVEFANPGHKGLRTWTSGWFALTEDSELKIVAGDSDPVAVVSSSQFATEAKEARDEAQAAVAGVGAALDAAVASTIAEVEEISGLTGEDAAVALLVADTGSETATALSATYARKGEAGTELVYTPVYTGFFADQTSATDTSSPTKWANSSHLTNTALRAWADYVLAQADAAGAIPAGSPKIVWFGDSWIDQGEASILSAATLAIRPTATVVSNGVGGNTSQNLIDRFATDVPTDADVVIFNEPGVNDAAGATTLAAQLDNLVALVRKIKAIDAVPVFTGHVPLTDYPLAATYNTRLSAIIGTGKDFLGAAGTNAVTANVNRPASTLKDSIGLNPTALAAVGTFTPGNGNLAGGHKAAEKMTTGRGSTALGAYALQNGTTTVEATAVGNYALNEQTTGNYMVGVGSNAGRKVSTATQSVLVGTDAGYRGLDTLTTNALTTANEVTFVGTGTMGTNGTNGGATAIGAFATAGLNATAIGRRVSAIGDGSVAIGRDASGVSASATFANYFALGTANHIVQVQGYLRIDRKQTTVGAAGTAAALPAQPSRYFIIRGDDAIDYVVPAYAKGA